MEKIRKKGGTLFENREELGEVLLWPFGSGRERIDLVLFCLFSIRRRTTVIKERKVFMFG